MRYVRRKRFSNVAVMVMLTVGVMANCRNGRMEEASAESFLSPDKKYEAKETGSGDNKQYEVIEVATKKHVITTEPRYDSPNSVKGKGFSPDSKQFAAAYHYGHDMTDDDGNPVKEHTWIKVWDLETGAAVKESIKKGFITGIGFVFEKTKK